MKTTKQRLSEYRKQAEECKANHPDWNHYTDWRHWKRDIWQSPNNVRCSGDVLSRQRGAILSYSLDQYGTNLGDVDKLNRNIDHTGWYSDPYCHGLIKGTVVKLRCPKGTLYIPATYSTEWDSSIHYIQDAELVPKGSDEYDHEEAIKEAARSADWYAEQEAEEAREHAAKSAAEQDIAEARSEIHEINKTALALIKEIKEAHRKFTPAVCTALTSQLHHMLGERGAKFSLIAKREEDFWTAVTSW